MTATNRKSGFFRSLLDAIVEARQREANRYVNGVLLAFDDDTLLRYGYSRAELSKRPNSIRTISEHLSASGGASPTRRG